MKWLNRILFKMVKEASAEESVKNLNVQAEPIRRENRFDGGMRFTLHKANGGYVVEYLHRSPSLAATLVNTKYQDTIPEIKLHIITSDQDLGQQLAHIVTYEALQQ